ncbi:MAG: glycosyltransferase family 2 protein [Desulfobacteraceae bacterium]|nr:MAG: glycosyltransferase family 2 protein [Desulfobacteraceae bacterium]
MPDTRPSKVLVSILNFNKIEDTIKTIECFKEQTYPAMDLMVIDNASTNDCVARLHVHFPDLKIISLPENRGYTGGNNVALEIGLRENYDSVVLSNNDIVVEKDIIANLVQAANRRPLCGIVGVIEKDYYTGETKAMGGKGFNFFRGTGHWAVSIKAAGDRIVEADYVQGALVLFTRRALTAGILFDQDLFMYYDEVDLHFQLVEKGLKAFVDIGSVVRHKSPQNHFNLLQGYFIQRNRVYLSRKYAPWYIYPLTLIYMAGMELPVKILLRSLQGHFQYARACALGFIDGLGGRMLFGRGQGFLS